jgi:hypothetical protein
MAKDVRRDVKKDVKKGVKKRDKKPSVRCSPMDSRPRESPPSWMSPWKKCSVSAKRNG